LNQISKIKNQKFYFDENHLDYLLKRWNKTPGKKIIHLFDLPDYITVEFSKNGRIKLEQIYTKLRKKGLDRLSRKFNINIYKLHDYINNKSKRLTVKSLKELSKVSSNLRIDFDINKIEKQIISIKSGRRSNILNKKQLFPLKLDKKEWAFIFGVLPDSHLKRFSFYSINKDFIDQISDNLKKIGFDGKVKNNARTNQSRIISTILSLAGIDTTKKQLYSNNAFPFWFFDTSKEFQAIVLSKVVDTEGNFSKRMIRIAQSTSISLTKKEIDKIISQGKSYIIKKSKSKINMLGFKGLPNNLKSKVLKKPSLILTSTQLLLIKNNIYSVVYPTRITISENSISSEWQLIIQGYRNIDRFYNLCGDYLVLKNMNIENYLKNSQDHLPKNFRIIYYLSQALKIQDSKGNFTTEDIIKKTNKNKKNITNTLGELAKLNLIESHEKNRRFKQWKISKKGLKYNQENINPNSLD